MLAIKGLRIFVVGLRLEGQQNRTKFSGFGLNKLEDGPAQTVTTKFGNHEQLVFIYSLNCYSLNALAVTQAGFEPANAKV